MTKVVVIVYSNKFKFVAKSFGSKLVAVRSQVANDSIFPGGNLCSKKGLNTDGSDTFQKFGELSFRTACKIIDHVTTTLLPMVHISWLPRLSLHYVTSLFIGRCRCIMLETFFLFFWRDLLPPSPLLYIGGCYIDKIP